MRERGQQMTHTKKNNLKFIKNKKMHYPEKEAYLYIRQQFADQGITLKEMAIEAKRDQDEHGVKASVEDYIKAIENLLHKHDVLSIILTGFSIDRLAEQHKLPEPLQAIVENDLPLYSVDELLSIGLTEMYGGIAVTNYGFRDVKKRQLAKRVDESKDHVNCFLDDLVSAIIACAEAIVAHGLQENKASFTDIDKKFE